MSNRSGIKTVSSEYRISRITSREAQRKARQIVKIYRDVWLVTYPDEEADITIDDINAKFASIQELIDEWSNTILQSEDRGYWIASDGDGNLAGFCIAKLGDHENELEYLYLLPGAQGKGLGTRLMNMALEWMGSVKPVILYGAAHNRKAISFYNKLGFVLSAEQACPRGLPNGKIIPSIKMIKYG